MWQIVQEILDNPVLVNIAGVSKRVLIAAIHGAVLTVQVIRQAQYLNISSRHGRNPARVGYLAGIALCTFVVEYGVPQGSIVGWFIFLAVLVPFL